MPIVPKRDRMRRAVRCRASLPAWLLAILPLGIAAFATRAMFFPVPHTVSATSSADTPCPKRCGDDTVATILGGFFFIAAPGVTGIIASVCMACRRIDANAVGLRWLTPAGHRFALWEDVQDWECGIIYTSSPKGGESRHEYLRIVTRSGGLNLNYATWTNLDALAEHLLDFAPKKYTLPTTTAAISVSVDEPR